MEWTPASKDEMLAEMERQWAGIDPRIRMHLSRHLVEPRPASIERFGRSENAFIVAQSGATVVFFDDVEEIFGTAEESNGKLLHPAGFGNIAIALRALDRHARRRLSTNS
jgi:hypothetical protein